MPETLLSLQRLAQSHDTAIMRLVMTHLEEATEGSFRRGPGRPPSIRGGVEVVALSGPLMPGVSLMELIFGIEGGLSSFQRSFSRAASDPEVGAIVMNVDSPGGLVDQIPETAEMIRTARNKKPVVAVANTLAASAAYWLASQADEIIVTPSGEVGSIGVFATHMDQSKALEQKGISVSIVSAGKYKIEGNPYGPLNSDAQEHIQEGVDDYYNMFVKDVATGRNAAVKDVKSGYGEGRVLTAKRSVEVGLADRVDTLDNVVAGLVRRSTGTEQVAADAVEVEYTSEERERLVGMSGTLDYSKITKEVLPA